jgi:CotS family spore coat protein
MTLKAEVEKEYGIKVLDWKPVKDVFQIRCKPHGVLCLKPYKCVFEEVQFIAAVQEHVYQQGFRYVPKTLRTRDDQLAIQYAHQWYMLTPWVAGKAPVFRDARQLHDAIRTLGVFHTHAQNFPRSSVPPKRYKIDHILEQLVQDRKLIQRSYQGTDRMTLLNLCDESIRQFRHPKVSKAIIHEAALGALIHGDYNYPNIVRDVRRHYHLIDFENASMNTRMEDLAHIIHRNAPWQPEKMMRLIDWYDHARPLNSGDLSILAALLYRPYPVVRSLHQQRLRRKKRQIVVPSRAIVNQFVSRLQRL